MANLFSHKNRGGRIVVLVLATIAVGIAIVIWLVGANNSADHTSTPGVPHNQTVPQGSGNSPDPVKQKNGPNGEIHPSPSGTGPGSDNSLLGPHQ